MITVFPADVALNWDRFGPPASELVDSLVKGMTPRPGGRHYQLDLSGLDDGQQRNVKTAFVEVLVQEWSVGETKGMSMVPGGYACRALELLKDFNEAVVPGVRQGMDVMI